MSRIVTIAERKARETARRRAAADLVMSEMRAFGTEHGGKFLIFGSAAEDRMKFDSDLDVVIDFPAEQESEAYNFVEDACCRQNLPADIHLKSTSSSGFLDRIRNHMIQVPCQHTAMTASIMAALQRLVEADPTDCHRDP